MYDKVWDHKLKQYKTIQEYHENLFHSILTLDNIDSILKRTQEAQQLLKLTKKVTKAREAEIGELMKKEIRFIITVLKYLKSDMFQAITREKSKLKNAQDNLEKNIWGISDYSAISSIQQNRLDKQIGQFEELQRVLVKV